MEVSNRDSLESFLQINGCKDPKGALAPLEGLFAKIDNGSYGLTAQKDLNQCQVSGSVALATGEVVSKVLFISLDNPFFKPDWMTENAYFDSLENSLQIASHCDLIAKINIIFWEDVEYRLRIKQELFDHIDISLIRDLACVVMDDFNFSLINNTQNAGWLNFVLSLVHDLEFGFKNEIRMSLFYYLCYCLLNDQEKIARLKPLMDLWNQCLPLGFKKGEPGTLLVICK